MKDASNPTTTERADWISPRYDDEVFAGGGHPMVPGSPQSHWLEDPPAADGREVVITDTDHYAVEVVHSRPPNPLSLTHRANDGR
jgi:hypothetical protein